MKGEFSLSGHVWGYTRHCETGKIVQRFSSDNRVVAQGLSSILYALMPSTISGNDYNGKNLGAIILRVVDPGGVDPGG